jgi:hypothetical protein
MRDHNSISGDVAAASLLNAALVAILGLAGIAGGTWGLITYSASWREDWGLLLIGTNIILGGVSMVGWGLRRFRRRHGGRDGEPR